MDVLHCYHSTKIVENVSQQNVFYTSPSFPLHLERDVAKNLAKHMEDSLPLNFVHLLPVTIEV